MRIRSSRSRSIASIVFIALAPATVMVTVLVAACSTPDTNGRVDPIGPDRPQFDVVAPMLVKKCGTLDCHGETHRNFRLYGYGGLRLARTDIDGNRTPDLGGQDIGSDEIEKDYDAVLGIEPEIMRQVVLDKGAAPERLSLVRKARGTEDHKGTSAITTGDDSDKCLISWLASAVDKDACCHAVDRGGCNPPPPDASTTTPTDASPSDADALSDASVVSDATAKD